MSVVKALEHASMRVGRKLNIQVCSFCPFFFVLVFLADPRALLFVSSSGLSRHISSRKLSTRIPSSTTMLGRLFAPLGSFLPFLFPFPPELRVGSPQPSFFALVRGILVPGGFGVRGTEGMIVAVKWAREHKVPYLGICLGMQVAVIEWARNVCGMTG